MGGLEAVKGLEHMYDIETSVFGIFGTNQIEPWNTRFLLLCDFLVVLDPKIHQH